jgi:hypothetical protein
VAVDGDVLAKAAGGAMPSVVSVRVTGKQGRDSDERPDKTSKKPKTHGKDSHRGKRGGR